MADPTKPPPPPTSTAAKIKRIQDEARPPDAPDAALPPPSDATDPKLLAGLQANLAALRDAKAARVAAEAALKVAQDAADGAVAKVEHLHQRLLADLVGLSAGDLANNFVYVSDAEAASLAKAASAAKMDVALFAKKKLVG